MTGGNLKAQANIEFIISIVIFLIVVMFISFSIFSNYRVFHAESEKNIIKSKGFMISELLILDKGYPNNWNNLNNVQRIGLAERPYVLNREKVLAIDSCSPDNYTRIKNLLGLSHEYTLIINITKINLTTGEEEPVAWCGPASISFFTPLFWTKRVAVLENNIVKVSVVVF